LGTGDLFTFEALQTIKRSNTVEYATTNDPATNECYNEQFYQ